MNKQTTFKVAGMEFVKTEDKDMAGRLQSVTFSELNSTAAEPFKIVCSKTGMHVGSMSRAIEGQAELQEFAKFISDCWTAHRKQMTKIVTTIAGH